MSIAGIPGRILCLGLLISLAAGAHGTAMADLLARRSRLVRRLLGRALAPDKMDRLTQQIQSLDRPEEELRGLPAVSRTFVEEGEATLYSSAVQETLAGVMELAERHGATLSDVYIRRASLEDVFLQLTGRRVRE